MQQQHSDEINAYMGKQTVTDVTAKSLSGLESLGKFFNWENISNSLL